MTIRNTSISTYNKIKSEGLLSTKRMRVYDIFVDKGNLTGSQVATYYKSKYPSNNHSETIRNRITELVQMKVLEELGTTECPVSSREVLLFGVSNQLPEKLPVKKTKSQKVSEIMLEVEKGLKHSHNDMFGEPYREILMKIKEQLKSV